MAFADISLGFDWISKAFVIFLTWLLVIESNTQNSKTRLKERNKVKRTAIIVNPSMSNAEQIIRLYRINIF